MDDDMPATIPFESARGSIRAGDSGGRDMTMAGDSGGAVIAPNVPNNPTRGGKGARKAG